MIWLTPDDKHPIRYQRSYLPANTNPPVPESANVKPNSPQQPAARSSLNWIIFGATGHIGTHLTRTVLALGDKIAACAINALSDSIQISPEFADRCIPFYVDVRSESSVNTTVNAVIEQFGTIDIVVNCFGWGIAAACEDQTQKEVREQLDTNLLGIFHTIRATLPHLRQNAIDQRKKRQKSPTKEKNASDIGPFPTKIFNFSSVLGIQGIPGLGPYSASKNAVEGLTESLMYEVEDMGCKAILVQMGHSSSETHQAESGDSPSNETTNPDDYSEVGDNENHGNNNDDNNNNKPGSFRVKTPSETYINTPVDIGGTILRNIFQPGFRGTSINRACAIVWETAHCELPPMRLILGTQALETMRDKLRTSVEEIEDWKYLYE